jgi:hypothetical protein
MRRWIALVLITQSLTTFAETPGQALTPSSPDIGPPGAARVEQVPPATPTVQTAKQVRCGLGFYLEPTVMVGLGSTGSAPAYFQIKSNVGMLFGSIALGPVARICDSDRLAATHVRLGGLLYLTQMHTAGTADGTGGVGLELAVDRPITPTLRLGGRASINTFSGDGKRLYTVGPRLHFDDLWFVGVDGYLTTYSPYSVRCNVSTVPGCTEKTTGVMIGGGIEGVSGRVLGGVGLIVLVVGGIVLAAGLGAVH